MNLRKTLLSIFLLSLALTQVGCKQNRKFEITAEKSSEVKIIRFDQAILSIKPENADTATEKLFVDYPTFMESFALDVMSENPQDKKAIASLIKKFLADTTFTQVNNDVRKTFANVEVFENDLSAAFSKIKSTFPNFKVPEVYFFVSGFNQSLLFGDGFVGIGVDMYLGSDYPAYAEIAYNYMTYNMNPEGITVDIVSALLFQQFPLISNTERLLEGMLYRGKMMYLTSVFLPQYEPYQIMGYSKQQWEWARKFEQDIWLTMLDQKDLYSTDNMLMRKYLNDAPFTTPISQESPGRLGTWVGWQIIRSYMNKNKNVTLQQLMNETNYQKILNASGYGS